MTAFLTDEWLDEMEATARSAVVPPDLQLVVQQVVIDEADGTEVAYHLELAGGRLAVHPGRATAPDVTFTQDRATAAAIARGALSAQVAFMAGRLRVGGDLRHLLERSRELAALDDLFAAARRVTTW